MLTDAQELQINSTTQYTHDYSSEAEDIEDDVDDEYTERFELSIKDQYKVKYDSANDLGGLTVYFLGDTLVAFYDYERFKGSVFA